MTDRCFVAVDWSNLEGRLTAWASGDEVMTRELEDELHGGPKLHALNAALIYDLASPDDAKRTLVKIQGATKTAYDGGKRLSHLKNYGGKAAKAAKTLWLDKEFVDAAFVKLDAKYTAVNAWRKSLTDKVFGVFRWRCPRCQYEVVGEWTNCPICLGDPTVSFNIPMAYVGVETPPARENRTPFNRLRRYLGRRGEGANALASQIPQGGGASMWYITFCRLHGYDPVGRKPWWTPPGVLQYDPNAAYGHLFVPADIFVATGTYDSFVMETPTERADEVLSWMLRTMEVAWPQMDGWRFPAEGAKGFNMGEWSDDNPNGLKEIKRDAFTY